MMSRTGNKGFTLVEIMVTTAVLSLGIVFLYQAFFISLDAFDYYDNYIHTAHWMDEQIWQAQNQLSCFGPEAKIASGGDLERSGRVFNWNLYYNLEDASGSLYWIRLDLSWKRGKRQLELSREAYALYEARE